MRYMFPTYSPVAGRFNPGYDGAGDGAAGGGEGAGGGVTMEQVNAAVNTTVNNAIANLRKSDLPKMFETHVGPLATQLTAITDTLKTLQGGGGHDGQGGKGGDKDGAGGVPPKINVKINELTATVKNQGSTIEKLTKDKADADQRAERAERHGTIKSVLSTLEFVTPKAADTAFTIVEPLVKRVEDGTLVAGDNLTVEAFIKDFLPKEHAYLIKSSGASGSGASGGSGAGGRGAAAGRVDTSSIKPGMSGEDRAKAAGAILGVLQGIPQ